MNETLSVFLNLDLAKGMENEELLSQIDRLLSSAGMDYCAMNLYVPRDMQKRDQTVFRAQKLLRNTEWLKGILAYTLIGTLSNACPIEEIRTDAMANPSPEKLWYYEDYWKKTHRFPHAVVVDEGKQLRDGYISYLLAKKYHVDADVCEMVSGQPLRKIVKGSHVEFSDGKWRKKSKKRYIWIYTLREPVVPGDILLADTKTGADFMCVDRIEYTAGYGFCSKYKKIRKHLNMKMEEREGEGHEE